MKILEGLLKQRKLALTLALMLFALGLYSWSMMTRREDPEILNFWGQVVVTYPGADAETVERLVMEPLEDALAEVDEIKVTNGRANSEIALIWVELRDDLLATQEAVERAWDEVQRALDHGRQELPPGVGEPVLDRDQGEPESIVLALTGHPDPLVLAEAAERLKDALQSLSRVSRVELIADPQEAVYVEYDEVAARRLELSPEQLAQQLRSRNQALAGGSVEVAGRVVSLLPRTEFESLEEIRATPIQLPTGGSVPLAAVARVRHGPLEPATSRMRFNRRSGMGLGVIPRDGVSFVDFGEDVRRRVAEIAPSLEPVAVEEVIYQPAWVEARLSNLGRSLLVGVSLVAGILLLTMGLRLGLVVSSVVPLVAFSALAVYAMGGGVLHQISVAALVIALGMLVDNAIVMAEGVQWRLDAGEPPREAALGAVRELALPLAGATFTTVAAFVPMLLAKGSTAIFTRAVPVVIIITLSLSYLFAVFVTPSLARLFLRRRRHAAGGGSWSRVALPLSRLGVRYPIWMLALSVLLVAWALASAGGVRRSFFPPSDREQLIVDVRLPEGSHLSATDAETARLERTLLARPEVVSVASYVGRSVPHFYYNLPHFTWSPHLAQLVVRARDRDDMDELMSWLRRFALEQMPTVDVVARKLAQGPRTAAPVELRLYGSDLGQLYEGAERVLAEVRATPGTEDVRHNMSIGTPVLSFQVDDAAASRRGLARSDVAAALFGRTRGLSAGLYRAGEDPVPVLVRSSAGERYDAADLEQIDIARSGGSPVPLSQVARVEVGWRPAKIEHRNGERVASIYSELSGNATYSEVLDRLVPRLRRLELPPGVRLELGGAAESSQEANRAQLQVMPVGILLLLGILMAEFRSFRRVGIILTTVPLAAVGIIPGLLFSGEPFGFLSLLGIIALVGIVVNNAIVLLEVVEARRDEGAEIAEALTDAVERRLRPIVLTTATTVSGLLPLALSTSSMWPPMAWAMISGLSASTFLTLVVVPALYRLLFSPREVLPGLSRGIAQRATAGGLLVLGMVVSSAAAAHSQGEVSRPVADAPVEELSLAEVLRRAQERPGAQAAQERAQALAYGAVAERRSALWPTVSGWASLSDQDREFILDTPIGAFDFGSSSTFDARLGMHQPLLEPAQLLFKSRAARAEAEAAAETARRTDQEVSARAAEAFFQVLSLDARLAATQAFVESLEQRAREVESRVSEGRALEADLLKVRLALDSARQDRLALNQARGVSARLLGQSLGLDKAVEPVLEPLPEPPTPEIEPALERALRARPDLKALEERLRGLELRRRGVGAERLPSLSADLSWNYSTGTPFNDSSWLEGRLAVSWRPFAAGSRGPRMAALAAEAEALRLDLTEARRTVELELERARAEIETARGALRVGEVGVAQAAETLRVEEVRHVAGRVTTNDLLVAEAELREQRTRRDLARLRLLLAWIRFELAVGEESAEGLLPPASGAG